MSFTVFTGTSIPAAATLMAPAGTTDDSTPTYQWNEVGGAVRYRVYVLDGDRQFAYGTTVQPRNACSGGLCSHTSTTVLVDGDYRWFIRAENPLGGTWSSPQPFTVFTGTSAPGAPVLASPSGTTNDSTPTYTWNEVTGAIQYKVYVLDGDRQFAYGTVVQAQNACSGGTCSHTPTTALPDGDYRGYIQAINPLGATWSSPQPFTVFTGTSAPGAAVLTSPSGTIADSTPTYVWQAAAGALQYQLYLVTGSGQFVASVYVQAQNACTAGSCSLTPTTALAPGSYRWFVRAINPLGATWSTPMTFVLQP